MSDNTKTPEELAKLNQFRQTGGQFGERDHTDPDPELALGNGFRDVAYPLNVKVRLERWADRDHIQEIGVVEFDARAIFDAEALEDLGDVGGEAADRDWIFEEAVKVGLIDGHDGPFTVEEPDEFEDYFEHRESSGMVDAYPNADEILAAAKLDALMQRRTKALEEAARLLYDAGDGATLTKRVSELSSGDVLVQNVQRVTVNDTSESSAMPGFIMVETDFGYLYLDPEAEVEVEGA